MKYSKLVLPGLAIIAVSYGLARFSFGLFLPDIAQSLNMTSSTSGIISSLFYISYCITIIYSTIYSTEYGPKPIIISAGLSALIGLISIGLAPNVWILAFGVIMAGSSTGLISPPFGLAISLWISAHRQSSANTWVNSGTSIGLVFAGLSTMLLPLEWRNVYLIYGLLAIAVTVWNYINLPQFDRDINIYTGSFNFRDVKGTKTLSTASLLLGISTAPYWTFSKSYIESLQIYSDTALSVFWILIGVFGILGGISGSIIERVGLATSYKFGVIVISFASVILALSPYSTVLPFISSSLFGLSYIFLTGALLVWGVTIFVKNASLGIGLPFLLLAVGQVFGSLMVGVSIDILGYSISFIIFGVIGFISLATTPNQDPVIREPKNLK